MISSKTAVVFGYGDMGIRCLKILRDAGLKISLVVTHKDSSQEKIWFGSLEKTALELGIPVMTPEDANSLELQSKIAELQPQFIFSFYYRNMIPTAMLKVASGGAFNMHGSLLLGRLIEYTS